MAVLGARLPTSDRPWPDGTFLGLLSGPDRELILGAGQPKAFSAGAGLLEQGRLEPPLFVVNSGFVKASRTAQPDSPPMLIDVHGAGDILGLDDVITQAQSHVSYIAAVDVTARLLLPSQFKAMLLRQDGIERAARISLALQLRQSHALLSYGQHQVSERVGAFIARMVLAYGVPDDEGVRIDIGLSQGDIGAAVGASEQMVSNVLRGLRTRRAIIIGRRSLVIRRGRGHLVDAQLGDPDEVPLAVAGGGPIQDRG